MASSPKPVAPRRRRFALEVPMSLAGGLIAGMLAACTSSSSNPGGGGASSDSGRVADATLGEGGWGGDGQAAPPTLAQCIAGVVSGPPPSECAPLVSCLEADVDASSPGCGADLIACFGADYASGTVWGECQSFTSCAMQSSCTAAAGESCISQTSSTCAQCILGQLLTCARKSCSSPLGACVNGLLSGLSDAGAGDSSAADTAAVDSQAPDSQVPEGGTEASARDGSTE